MLRLTTITVLSAVLLTPACNDAGSDRGLRSASLSGGESYATKPEDVARAFFEAARSDDQGRFSGLLTEEARAGMSTGDGFELRGDSVGDFRVGAAIRSESEADVPVTVVLDGEESEVKLRMRHQDSAWRVWGVDIDMGEGTALTLDFESLGDMARIVEDELAGALEEAFDEAFTEMTMGGSEEEIRAAREGFEATAPLSSAAFDAGWRVDLDVRDRRALDVLQELLSGSGLELASDGAERVLDRGVSLALRGVSRLEAIERVCEEIGTFPVYPELGWYADTPDAHSLRLEAGRRAQPVAFAGPFLVEVTSLEENAPYGTGSLTLTVHGLGIPRGAMPLASEMIELIAVDSVTDVRENDLNADAGVHFMGQPEIEGRYLTTSLTLDLKNLLRDVKTLAVTGELMLGFPTAVHDVRWSGGGTQEQRVGEYTVGLESWDSSAQFAVRTSGDLEALQVRLSALDAAREPLGAQYTDSSNWGDRIHASIQTNEPPAIVDMKICELERVEYSFELSGVELSRYAEMPTQLETLRFRGATPLDVEFVAFTKRDEQFPEIEISLRNAANKDAESATVTFFYLDSAGKDLEDFPHTLSGEFTFEGHAPLVTAGASAAQEVTAFFMPTETARVRIRVDEVTFVDASTWQREE